MKIHDVHVQSYSSSSNTRGFPSFNLSSFWHFSSSKNLSSAALVEFSNASIPSPCFSIPLCNIIFILFFAFAFNLTSLFIADSIFSLLVSLSSIFETDTFSVFVTSTRLEDSCRSETSPESPPMHRRKPSEWGVRQWAGPSCTWTRLWEVGE